MTPSCGREIGCTRCAFCPFAIFCAMATEIEVLLTHAQASQACPLR